MNTIKPVTGSLEWYNEKLPVGVIVNEEKTHYAGIGEICLDIDTNEYPTPSSQVAVINWCELGIILWSEAANYSVNGEDYLSAKEFRELHGFDNTFFEKP